MINTNMRATTQWYYDAVVGYLIYSGYTRKEAKAMVRKYRLKKLLKKYTVYILHDPIEATVKRVIEINRKS